jgi:hypothetical protein
MILMVVDKLLPSPWWLFSRLRWFVRQTALILVIIEEIAVAMVIVLLTGIHGGCLAIRMVLCSNGCLADYNVSGWCSAYCMLWFCWLRKSLLWCSGCATDCSGSLENFLSYILLVLKSGPTF